MAHTYSAYEAKARFSEVIRKVRAGQRVTIAYRGEEVAEISPIERPGKSLEKSLRRLEELGVVEGSRKPMGRFRPVAKRPGALARFLDSRK
ncbi:MAG TPA: type II toxin-antitoxin system prevent-host-death family antitoxin [Bryobacterales bacterium]|nr:type II toxin-antitoxin system prevent-host-death family antitoxin [Bryobacterales bacterium]